MRIEDEIDQKFFPNEFLKANINLVYTAGWIQLQVANELKPFLISVQQFNILRILRGRHPRPCSVRELTDRMLDKSSNASRLVDKLVAKDLASKSVCPLDNRRLEVNITEHGLETIQAASEKVEGRIIEIFGALSEVEATSLNSILDSLRG